MADPLSGFFMAPAIKSGEIAPPPSQIVDLASAFLNRSSRFRFIHLMPLSSLCRAATSLWKTKSYRHGSLDCIRGTVRHAVQARGSLDELVAGQRIGSGARSTAAR